MTRQSLQFLSKANENIFKPQSKTTQFNTSSVEIIGIKEEGKREQIINDMQWYGYKNSAPTLFILILDF